MSGSWFDPKSLNTALQAAASMATEALKEDPEKEELLQELHDLKKAYLSLKSKLLWFGLLRIIVVGAGRRD